MNFILKDENAVFYECGFSCDNVVFLKLGSEAFFITDARYTTEAKGGSKNATVLEGDRRDLLKTGRQDSGLKHYALIRVSGALMPMRDSVTNLLSHFKKAKLFARKTHYQNPK